MDRSATLISIVRRQIDLLFSNDPKAIEKISRARYMRNVYSPSVRRIKVTLTHAQYDELSRIAKDHGQSPSTFLRESSFAYIHNRYITPEWLKSAFKSFVFLCRNIANNINQIALRANTYKFRSIIDPIKLKSSVQQLEKEVLIFTQNPLAFHDHQIPLPKKTDLSSIDKISERKAKTFTP